MIEFTRGERVSPRNLNPGDFATFTYRDSDGEHSEREILVAAYDGDSDLLHGLDLDKFDDAALMTTARELARRSQEFDEMAERYMDSDEILLEEVQDSEMEEWYEVDYEIDRFDSNPYRTFRTDRINLLREARVFIT